MTKVLGAWPSPWGLGQGRGGVANAVGAFCKAVWAWPRTWERGKDLGGVAKTVNVNPNSTPSPKAVGRSQGYGGMAKALGNRWGVAKA